jgi:hypothetical protein
VPNCNTLQLDPHGFYTYAIKIRRFWDERTALAAEEKRVRGHPLGLRDGVGSENLKA